METQQRIDIKRNDTVKVITGRDKGKQGRVLRVFPGEGKILVEHVMMMKRAVKAVQGKTKGGIAEKESRINVSNVQLVCASCGKPSRIGHEMKGDRKVRVCKQCDAPMDK
jgi:large subunit ribosomal protein L24